MQVKDIPTEPIIELLKKNPGKWHHWYSEAMGGLSVLPAFPEEVRGKDKLVLAKMSSLIKKKLIHGCACGCRGDFYID